MGAEHKKGIFISLEGIEGCGKTTQGKLLSAYLSARGHDVVLTHEPGGTIIGDRIRGVLLMPEHKEMSYITELLLYNAARAQHLSEKILPALDSGKIVITDRFTDSTVAYQGHGRGIDISLIESINSLATAGTRPDLTILFDLEAETGLRRNRGANKVDRMELEDIGFHKKVRRGFLHMAESEKERICIVDASRSIEQINGRVIEIIAGRYGV